MKNVSKINIKNFPLNFRLCLLVFLVIIIVSNFLGLRVAANSNDARVNSSNKYIQVLNYSFPFIQLTSSNSTDYQDNSVSIKSSILSLCGISYNNPLKTIEKEISCFSAANCGIQVGSQNITPTKEENIFNPFKLEESNISKTKTETTDSQQQQNTENLPNQTVTVYDPKLKKQLNMEKPEVLIYHTHTCEGYKPGKPDNTDQTQGVCAVGDAITDELQKNYGIAVIHDKTVHDLQSYNNSYARSAQTVDKYLKKYGDFKLVIDLHRDSTDNKDAVTARMNNENVAKFMFVMARKNPHYNKNIEVVNKLSDISSKLFPGFQMRTFFYDNGTLFFNQGKSNNAVLVEVGSDLSTIDEAKASGKYLARIMAEYINKK